MLEIKRVIALCNANIYSVKVKTFSFTTCSSVYSSGIYETRLSDEHWGCSARNEKTEIFSVAPFHSQRVSQFV